MFTDTELEFIQDHMRGWWEPSFTGDGPPLHLESLPPAMFDADLDEIQQAQAIIKKIINKKVHEMTTPLTEEERRAAEIDEKREAENKGQEKAE